MGRKLAPVTRDTLDAWKELVAITREIFPKTHPAAASTLSQENLLAIVEERLANRFHAHLIHRRIQVLKHAFPSSPQRPPLLGLSFRFENRDKYIHQNFAAIYPAKHFLDIVLSSNSYKWVSDDEIEIQSPDGYVWIKCDGLEAGLDTIVDYKFTSEEAAYILPDNIRAIALRISPAPEAAPRKKAIRQPEQVEKPARDAPSRQIRPKQPVASPKPSAEGLTTIGDVANSYGFDAKQARGIMRKAGIDKPSSGRWEWATVPASVHKAFKDAKK
jgi:hypothetical protein